MKSHVSIFAFLLGAFAAAIVPSAAQAVPRTIWIYGYYTADTPYEKKESITADTDQVWKVGDTVTLTANFGVMVNDGKGLAVDYWLEHENKTGDFVGTKIEGSEGDNPCVWTCTNNTGTSTFAVKCKYITYNLKYDANGGSSVSGGSHSYPDTYELEASPIREGYAFEGWKDGSGVTHEEEKNVSGASFAELDNVHTNGATVTLKAMWTVKNYTVLSEGSNCTVSVEPSAAYTNDLTISWEPVGGDWKNPKVKVYGGTDDTGTLLATYETANSTSATFNMSKIGKGYFENIFIKAAYNVHTLTFDANGGACDEKSRRVEDGESIGTLPIPKLYLMQYDGWYDDLAHGNQITATTKLREDITAYAHWTPADPITITTVAAPLEGGTAEGGGNFEKGATTNLTATAATGYSFEKWTEKFGEEEFFEPVVPITVTANKEYTAHFTGNVYQVRFTWEDEGVKGDLPSSKMVTFGKPYGMADAIPEDPDLVFDYWSDEDGNRITAESKVEIAGRHWLYAHVAGRPLYHVAFDGNGATSGSMATQKMYCGVASNLTLNAFARDGYHFRGWATNEADAAELKIAYEDGERVTDIAPTNGMVTLYAAWESISLAEAMHCDNLEWTNAKFGKQSHECKWSVDYGDGKGSNTLSCVTQDHSLKTRSVLTSGSITNSGTLSFYWRPLEQDGALAFWIDGKDDELSFPGEMIKLDGKANVWSFFSTNLTTSAVSRYVHIEGYTGVDVAHSIDLMTWTPGGPEPEEKDAVTIKTAAVSDGKFTLSFEFNEDFDYLLKTNANLLIDSWGVMEVEGTKTDDILTFEPEIIEGQPQMFYRVDTIQKK